MCTGPADLAQRDHERGEIDSGLIQIVDRAVGVRAWQPLIHRPVEGIALGRLPVASCTGSLSGRCGASFGSHSASFDACLVAPTMRASRAAMRSPIRKMS